MAGNSGNNALSSREVAKLQKKIKRHLLFSSLNSDEILECLGFEVSDVSIYSREYQMLICKDGTCWICQKEKGVVTFFPISERNKRLAEAGKQLGEIIIEETPHLETSLG